jgi:hypothetical protein
MNKILFTKPNRQATVEGRKTNTRRVMNPQPKILDPLTGLTDIFFIKPRYKVGEMVYIAEPYRIDNVDHDTGITIEYSYGEIKTFSLPAGCNAWIDKRLKEMDKSKSGFCNKMFMPEWAARDFIRITDIKAERLQDISDEDCFKEGIEFTDYGGNIVGVYGLLSGYNFIELGNTPREAYAAEIDMINGKGTWDSNPWMWSYYYELVKK